MAAPLSLPAEPFPAPTQSPQARFAAPPSRAASASNSATGDLAHVPAGVPHQMLVPGDNTFTAFVVKIQETN